MGRRAARVVLVCVGLFEEREGVAGDNGVEGEGGNGV